MDRLLHFHHMHGFPSPFILPTHRIARRYLQLVFAESKRSTKYFIGDQYAKDWPYDDGIPRPTLFPHPLSSACILWRDILLTFPEFWSRFVVFLDSKFNPSWLPDFRFELATSETNAFKSLSWGTIPTPPQPSKKSIYVLSWISSLLICNAVPGFLSICSIRRHFLQCAITLALPLV